MIGYIIIALSIAGILATLAVLIEEIIKNSSWYQEKRRRNLQKKFTIVKGGKR